MTTRGGCVDGARRPQAAALAVALAFAPVPPAEAQDGTDWVALGMDCIDSRGGPEACDAVFGWCDPTWGFDRRRACEAALAERWDGILNVLWSELKPPVEAWDRGDEIDDVAPLWTSLVAEQRAWIALRDATCAWSFEGEGLGSVTGREEARSICLARMTQGRAQELYEMRQFLLTNAP